MPRMSYKIKSIVTRKLEGVNHFHYYLYRQLKGGGMESEMTRGYFVVEKKGKITEAAELSGSAYLSGGYGENILTAFHQGRAEMYLRELYEGMSRQAQKDIHRICPEWYRKTKYTGKQDYIEEYGYVLRNKSLTVYNYGKKLFDTTQENASIWLFVIKNLERFINTYLYSEERLDINYGNKKKMFAMLSERIVQGCTIEELDRELRPVEFVPMLLRDDHCMDVWYRPERPAYKKILEIGNRKITFIVSKSYRKWKIRIQLPYIRVGLLGEYSSEKKAMDILRSFCKENRVLLERYAEVFVYVEKLFELMKDDKNFDIANCKEKLEQMYKEKPWLHIGDYFSVEEIIKELKLRGKRYV